LSYGLGCFVVEDENTIGKLLLFCFAIEKPYNTK